MVSSVTRRYGRLPLFLAGLWLVLAAVGCDGVVGADLPLRELPLEVDLPASAPAVETASAALHKVTPELLRAVESGQPQVAIVVMDEPAAGGDELDTLLDVAARDAARVARYQAAGAGLRARVASSGVSIDTLFQNFPVVVATVATRAQLEQLAAQPGVRFVHENRELTLSDTESFDMIDQPEAAAAGKTGSGYSVAVLDTGADITRAAFGPCSAAGAAGCKVAYAADFAPADGQHDDPAIMHGTNVSGIVLGVAPQAKVLALDVFQGGSSTDAWVLAAVDWAINNRATYNIAALNLSLGGGAFAGRCDAYGQSVALASARAQGILAAVATGNNAYANAVGYPSCATAAVAVGAVYKQAYAGTLNWGACVDASPAAGKVTCFSNSYPYIDLLAPGALITAAGLEQGGTSQACPHVAGAIAVLKQVYPSKTPTELVTELTSQGTPVTDARQGRVTPLLNLNASAGACVLNVASSKSVASDAGSDTLSLTTGSTCGWTATTSSGWLNITNASGTGSGSIGIGFTANTAEGSRTATVALAGAGAQTVNVSVVQTNDNTAPTGSVSINSGATYTGALDVSVTIQAGDLSGVAAYCLTDKTVCPGWTSWSGNTTAGFRFKKGNGVRTLRAFLRDTRGNTSTLASAPSDSIVIDTGKPWNGSMSVVYGDAQNVLSFAGFGDGLSGLAAHRVAVVAGGTKVPKSCAAAALVADVSASATAYTHTGLTNGVSYAYIVCAKDNVGNLSKGVGGVAQPRPESDAPTNGAVVINGGAAITGSQSVTLTLSATDATSIAAVCIAEGACKRWQAYAATTGFKLSKAAGSHTVQVQFRDPWNNATTATATDTIVLDNEKPSDGALSLATSGGGITASWSGISDRLSGVAGTCLAYGFKKPPKKCSCNPAALTATSTSSATIPGLAVGVTYGVRVCGVDTMGNEARGASGTIVVR